MASTSRRSDQGSGSSDQDAGAVSSTPPDAALGVWLSWMKGHMGPAGGPGLAVPGEHWLMGPDAAAGKMLSAGTEQLRTMLAGDPLLTSIDRMWNANPLHDVIPVDWAEVVRALRTVWLRSHGRSRPGRDRGLAELNAQGLELRRRGLEQRRRPLAGPGAAPRSRSGLGAGDKRFDAPEWHTNPAYRTLKDMYLLASDFLLKQVEAEDLEPAERERLRFHLQQFVNATSPTLLLLSNPAALRRAMETGGASLADGARNLLNDLKEGRLSMVDATAFEPGRNLAITPGKVVYRNRLIELIQYAPQTEKVHAVPLLFLPPWINKFYILDMQPKNSFVRYLVQQGFTVFMISWKNPDASMEGITFEDYMRDGPLAAAEVDPRDHRQPDGEPGRLLHRRHAPDPDPGLPGRPRDKRVRDGDLHGLDAGLRQGRRDRRLHGRALDRLHRAADDGARLSRQPRDGEHVQPACARTT